MNIQHPERRSASSPGQYGHRFDAGTVRQALAIQRQSSTLSAAEYLKANGVKPSVIVRILTSHTVRSEDRAQPGV